jgi:hypothetical protein
MFVVNLNTLILFSNLAGNWVDKYKIEYVGKQQDEFCEGNSFR